MDISALATNLEPEHNGILLTHSISAVSYPDEGNQRYREIEDGSYWFEHRNRCIVAVMNAFPPGGVVFDVGGGNGFVGAADVVNKFGLTLGR